MKHYGRNYRPVTQGDIESATRGLRLDKMSAKRLIDTLGHHAQVDMFASQVIVAACEVELDRRHEADCADPKRDAGLPLEPIA